MFFEFLLLGPFCSHPNDPLAFLEEDDVGKEDDGNNVLSHHAGCQLAQDQATMMNDNKQSKRGKNLLKMAMWKLSHGMLK